MAPASLSSATLAAAKLASTVLPAALYQAATSDLGWVLLVSALGLVLHGSCCRWNACLRPESA
jgi:hypothetical protein